MAAGSEIREVEADAAGARLAGQTLERIRALARSTAIEVVAPPYADLSIPSLVGSGLQGDIPAQIDEGRRMVERILGVRVPQTILPPPGSRLDRPAARALADLGIETVILNPGAVAPPLPGGSILSPVATARLPSRLTAIVPDEDVAAYVAGNAPPRLRAAHVIGELSALYLEQPSVLRGAAIVVRSEQSPAEDFLQPLLRALRDPPSRAAWLRPVKATQLAESVPATIPTGLRRSDPPTFSEPFVRELRTTRGLIDEFRAMAQGRTALPGRLRRLLLAAQDRRFVADQGPALDFIRAVRESLVREFRKIEAPSGTSITLTSHGGVIPLTLRSAATYPVRIRVTLRSPRLEFLEGPSQEVVLEEEAQALTFPVRAQTTGRFPVRILVDTPGGHRISESRIVVRSTAYNRIALFVTIGAAAFLALWWGRRFLRQTTT